MDKLYVIVDSALPSGLKMAQACHAMRAFADQHPEVEQAWFETSNNIVVLQAGALHALAERLKGEGHRLALFTEP